MVVQLALIYVRIWSQIKIKSSTKRKPSFLLRSCTFNWTIFFAIVRETHILQSHISSSCAEKRNPRSSESEYGRTITPPSCNNCPRAYPHHRSDMYVAWLVGSLQCNDGSGLKPSNLPRRGHSAAKWASIWMVFSRRHIASSKQSRHQCSDWCCLPTIDMLVVEVYLPTIPKEVRENSKRKFRYYIFFPRMAPKQFIASASKP